MIVHLHLAKLKKEWYGSNMTRLREVFMFPFALLLPFAGESSSPFWHTWQRTDSLYTKRWNQVGDNIIYKNVC